MNILTPLNKFRRKITRRSARFIGRTKPGTITSKVKPGEIRNILVNRPNKRLGNMLLITPLLQELIHNFPHCKIDLFVKGGLAPIVFKNYKQVNTIIRLPKKPFKELAKYIGVWFTIKQKKYDLVINVDKVSSSGRIATKVARGTYKFFGDENESKLSGLPDGSHMAKRPVYLLRENLELPVTDYSDEIPSLNIRLSEPEIKNGKAILEKYVPADKPTISIFTYATGAKCHSPEWWKSFYTALEKELPGYNFLEILPAENVSQLNFSIPSYHSMDIREIASVIANTRLFIGADSGMMHLASASLTPAIGLFNVTNMLVYEPYGNGSMGINTSETSLPEMLKTISLIASEHSS